MNMEMPKVNMGRNMANMGRNMANMEILWRKRNDNFEYGDEYEDILRIFRSLVKGCTFLLIDLT